MTASVPQIGSSHYHFRAFPSTATPHLPRCDVRLLRDSLPLSCWNCLLIDGQAPHPPTDMAHQRAPELGATFVPGGWDDYSMPEVVAPSPQRYVFLSLFGLNLLAAPCLPAPVSPAS
uniref:Uncharacterized protein n=1 Tax=Bionectria ochroleuca TaxID=29856 RepID=A0A8H7K6P9_BIOOC